MENLLFPFVFVPPLAPRSPAVPTFSIKEQFPISLGHKRARLAVCDVLQTPCHPLPPLSSPAVSGVWFEDVTRPSLTPAAPPWDQVSVAQLTQTPLRAASVPPELSPCVPPHCPTPGTSVVPLVPLTRCLGAWLALPSPSHWLICTIRLGYAIQFARRPPKFRGIHFTCAKQRCPCLTERDRSPPGEGRGRAGPSSRYEGRVLQPLLHCAQERWWVATNLGPANLEPGSAQTPVQDVNAKTHFRVHPSPRLVCSDRPEGRVLSCLDSPPTQAIPTVCVRGSSVSVQGPTLRAVPVASRLYESRGGSHCSSQRMRRSHSQLSRRLADPGTVSGPVVRTQGHGALSPQPVGTSGQLGKEQTLPCAEDLFSRYGVGLGQPDSATHRGARPVSVELPEFVQRQDSGPTETFSEAPGAYGIRSRSNAARVASYEAASALASRPSPEMGVAERHTPGVHHPVLSPNLQPMVRPFISTGRSPPRTSVQACCGFHGCLCHGLGGHVQLACSVGSVDGTSTALAHQLPRVASGTSCAGPPQRPLHGKHVLIRTDNTATVAYINRQGGLRSRRMWQLARHLLLWSQKHLRSLRAIHIPGVLNRAADELSRQPALPGEWRLHPQVVQLIWGLFGTAQVDLFASPDSTHCQLFYSLTEGTFGTDALAHSWPQGLRKYAFSPVSLLAQTLCKVRDDEEQVLLVAPYWPSRTWFSELMLLATAPPWPIPLRKDLLSQRRGTLWHPRPDLWKLHIWSLDGTRRF